MSPADRMAALIAAARSDEGARAGDADPVHRRRASGAGRTGRTGADSEPDDSVEAEEIPTKTGGWIPETRADDESNQSRLPRWLASRLPQSPRMGIALGAGVLVLVVMLIAGGIFAVRFATAAPAAHPVAGDAATATPGASAAPLSSVGPSDEPSESTAPAAPAPLPGTGASGTSSSGTGVSERVTVQVVGAVRKPGVVTLPAGSRVVDAIKAAGGAGGKADTAAVNMARKVVDGEQIRLPRVGEEPTPAAPSVQQPGDPAAGSAASPPGTTPASVNLNTADLTELETLPNIGPVTAQKIIDWRTQNNGFSSVEDLLDVSGIGPKTFAQLKDLVTV